MSVAYQPSPVLLSKELPADGTLLRLSTIAHEPAPGQPYAEEYFYEARYPYLTLLAQSGGILAELRGRTGVLVEEHFPIVPVDTPAEVSLKWGPKNGPLNLQRGLARLDKAADDLGCFFPGVDFYVSVADDGRPLLSAFVTNPRYRHAAQLLAAIRSGGVDAPNVPLW